LQQTSPDEQLPGLFYISKTPQSLVGANLLAIAECQSTCFSLTHRYREQARSHTGGMCFLEIVENNIHDLSKRDIKPLQITVLSGFRLVPVCCGAGCE